MLGSAVGLGLSAAILWSLHKLPDDMLPRASEIHLRFSVLAMLAVIAVAVTLLSSLLPVLLAWKVQPETALRGQSRASTPHAARSRMAGWLVSGEVAIAAILLVATGLLFHTLYNLEHQRLGFETQHVITFTATPPDSGGYLAFQSSIGNFAAAAPATSIANTIYRRFSTGCVICPECGSPRSPHPRLSTGSTSIPASMSSASPRASPVRTTRQAKIRVMSGGYSQAIGTAIVKGRAISDDDTASAPFVAVINQALADKYFRNVNPIGQQLDLGGKDTGMLKPYTIVGVLENNIRHNLTESDAAGAHALIPTDPKGLALLFLRARLGDPVHSAHQRRR